jgi:Tfp pilus assembly protein PilF
MISERERRKLQATGYLESRLQTNPQTARYSHCLAALYEDDHKGTEAGRTYKNAIKSAPNDVMVRSDYGLHLAYGGRKQDGVDEFRKGQSDLITATPYNLTLTPLSKFAHSSFD